jgi:hypothetical protein
VTAEEVARIADEFVGRKPGRLILRRVGMRRFDDEPGKWTVFYERDPGPQGGVSDGPVLVIVDDSTGVAGWFDDMF